MDDSDETQSIINQAIPAYKEITKKKINKPFCVIVSIFTLNVIINISLIIWYNFNNSLPPANGYPKENTNNHTLGNCYIYDECTIENINGTEKLVSHKKYKLPTQYKTDIYGTNCPSYWEATPTAFDMNNKCKDIGYGCCKLPINIDCSIRIKYEHLTGIYRTVFLYRKNGFTNKNLNIAKEDFNGTNCPNFERLMHEPLWYNSTVSNFIFCYTIITIILLLCITFNSINIKIFTYEKILVSSDTV